MSSSDTTKEQLQKEIQVLRLRVAELENQLDACMNIAVQERCPRVPLNARIEFIGDFDIVAARGVNISDGGICLSLSDDLPFEMQFEHDGRTVQRRAHLVWLRRHESDGYRSGFRFVDDEPAPEF
jgi:hypothetical protein